MSCSDWLPYVMLYSVASLGVGGTILLKPEEVNICKCLTFPDIKSFKTYCLSRLVSIYGLNGLGVDHL